jgi:ABC-type transport system involved in cytochrome bd biosynthesis fused ATPase/permease subunit
LFSKLADEDQRVSVIRRDQSRRARRGSDNQAPTREISIERLTVEYNAGAPAVKDLTLEIASGEMFVLLGPSG